MSYEHRPGSFSLFKADKGGNEKRPDYSGTGKDLDGNEIEVAAWLKESAKGKFMSCTFKLKSERQEKPKPASNPRDLSDINSDIPF